MDVELTFVAEVEDVDEFQDLLLEYYTGILPSVEAAGGPVLSAQDMAGSSIAHLEEMLPPDGRLVFARREDGLLLGCGALRRIRPDAVEMKRMFVRPEARGLGLGKKLFETRIDEARRMGCRLIFADTVKGNRPMLSMYERFGFEYIPRYPEIANPPDFDPFLVYLQYQLPEV